MLEPPCCPCGAGTGTVATNAVLELEQAALRKDRRITDGPQHQGDSAQHCTRPEPVNGTARPQSPHSTRPTASGRRLPTPRRAKAGERRSRPAKGGMQGLQWSDGERSAVPTVGGPAIRRQARKRRVEIGFALERRDTRQCGEPDSARLNAAAGRSAGPHPGRSASRDFRARCRISGPAAPWRGRQIGTDIRHSAGVVLARASNWERRRLYCGRINGMNDEDSAGDATLNPAPPGCRVHWHFKKRKGIGAASSGAAC